MPTYNLIPNATDQPSQSQAKLKENFESLQIIIEENHVAFNSANAGKHKKVIMPEQAADPTTIANEMALYTKEGSASGVSELYLKRETDGPAGSVYNLSEVILSGSGRACILPSGVKYQWGTTSSAGFNNTVVILPIAAANTSYSISVVQSQAAPPGNIKVAFNIINKTVNNFTVQPNIYNGAPTNTYIFSWIVIGE